MSNSVWCDLNSKCDTLKFHDISGRIGCNCEKQHVLSFGEFQLDGAVFLKKTKNKYSKELKRCGKISLNRS